MLDPSHGQVAKNEDGTYANSLDVIQGDKSASDGYIYDLTGRRVEKTQKGIYIIGGKKVLVK